MIEEARLESVESGLAPVTPGWFIVNARDAAWVNNDRTQGVCIFESDDFVLRGRPDLDEYVKPQAGNEWRAPSVCATSWRRERLTRSFVPSSSTTNSSASAARSSR